MTSKQNACFCPPVRRLEGLEGEVRVAERHGAGETVERLQPFDGITLDRRPDALPHGAVEIDEDSRPQQFVYFIDACPVPTYESLDRGWLIRGVMIDVHLRVLTPLLH